MVLITEDKFYNPYLPCAATHGRLPHWQQGCTVTFVTFRIADSLPATLLNALRNELSDIKAWLREHPDDKESAALLRDWHNKWERHLDAGHGSCVLQQAAARDIVEAALLHFNNDRYIMHSFVIMPNHVHAIIEPLPGYELTDILGSIKRFSSRKINILTGNDGKLWQRESFDRLVRSQEHYDSCRRYIRNNPLRLPSGTFTLWEAGQ